MKNELKITQFVGNKYRTSIFLKKQSKFFKKNKNEKQTLSGWKSKTQVTSYELRVQIHELQVQINELGVQIHELRVQIHELRIQIHELEH